MRPRTCGPDDQPAPTAFLDRLGLCWGYLFHSLGSHAMSAAPIAIAIRTSTSVILEKACAGRGDSCVLGSSFAASRIGPSDSPPG